MYKLIACDVDGTLFGADFTIPMENKSAIAKAQEMGVPFILCSGRSIKSLMEIHKYLELPAKDSYIISLNGSNIYNVESGVTVFEEQLDKAVNLEVVSLFLQRDRQGEVEIIVYTDAENILAETHSTTADNYAKICRLDVSFTEDIMADVAGLDKITRVVFLGKRDCLVGFREELLAALEGRADVFFSSEFLLEVGSVDCDKGFAVKFVSLELGLSLEQVITIGDNYNDLSMLSAAGMGVAVANAVDAAKEAAKYTTKKTAAQGAVAEVIEKFLL